MFHSGTTIPRNSVLVFSFILLIKEGRTVSLRQLTRVPGLHSLDSRPVAFPSFIAAQSSSATQTDNNKYGCPAANPNCPSECRKIDEFGCKLCICMREATRTAQCPAVSSSCPTSCQGVNKNNCPACHCESTTGAGSLSQLASARYCIAMVTCMLTCKSGYRLGKTSDENGCQSCICVKPSGKEHLQQYQSGETRGIGDSSSESTMMTMTNSESSWETVGTGSNIENSKSNANAASSWSSTGATSDRLLTGSGESGCTGPMCPSASEQGINPMFPGASMTSSSVSTGSESCVGPFCLGQDGGMGVSMTGGSGSMSSSGCQGPFCISGSMMGGGGGMMGGTGGGMMDGGAGMMGGAGGGMMGGGGGMMGGAGGGMMDGGAGMMGGAGGGMMGGGGGMMGGSGDFSPFSMSSIGSTGHSDNSGGCSGPFCTAMATVGGSASRRATIGYG